MNIPTARLTVKDDAEMDVVDARLGDQRDQQRREDQDRGGRLQHGADEQEDDVDDQEQRPRLHLKTGDCVHQSLAVTTQE